MKDQVDYNILVIHPTLEPIRKFFEFYILGIGFIGQFDFQKYFLKTHPSLRPLVERYNKEVNLRRDGGNTLSDTGFYWETLGRIMAIALFNILEASDYSSRINQTQLFKFANHLRNGSAHSNRFNITKTLKAPVKWRSKVIDNSLHGKEVFTSFIAPSELLQLMTDLTEEINSSTEG